MFSLSRRGRMAAIAFGCAGFALIVGLAFAPPLTQEAAAQQASGSTTIDGVQELRFRGGWTATTNYVTDDLVTLRNATWRARRNNINKVPGSTNPSTFADWQIFAGGLNPRGNWSSTTTYHLNDLVTHLGQTFRAKRTNINKSPTTNLTDWNLFAAKGQPGLDGISNGSVSSPGIRFSSSTNTGIFSPATGQIALAAGGELLLHHNGTAQTTALGVGALKANTGANNTALGHGALAANTIGVGNTAVGAGALGVSTRSSNVAVGSEAMAQTTAGLANVAVGERALGNLIVGDNNTAIGRGAGSSLTNGNGNLYIGSSGSAVESRTIRIGGLINDKIFLGAPRGVTTGVNNALPLLVDSSGQLGTVSSSRRYKEDITTMSDMSAMLQKLRPVTFRYIKPYDDGSRPIQYGLIAEEVAEVFPDLAALNPDGTLESVKYHLLPSFLLAGYQKQQQVIEAQQKTIDGLEQRLQRLEAMLARPASAQPAHLRVD